jgi:hypothetical protein
VAARPADRGGALCSNRVTRRREWQSIRALRRSASGPPIAQYVAEHGAIAERRYTLEEARKVSQAQKPRYYEPHHYGQWRPPVPIEDDQ